METNLAWLGIAAAPVAATTASVLRSGPYRARMAVTGRDRCAALRLRFLVFNLELNEGLDSAYGSGLDSDEFDSVCDHLIVEHEDSGEIIGTYRLQTGTMAARNLGYYSAREFDFTPYDVLRDEVLELGRACIHRDHRSADVLTLLWKGVMHYAISYRSRYLIGCSSLTSQDPMEGATVFNRLRPYQVDPELLTHPLPAFALKLPATADVKEPPKLLRAYLALGAKICGPPAIDREFKTIDFLTLMDLQAMHPRLRARYSGL